MHQEHGTSFLQKRKTAVACSSGGRKHAAPTGWAAGKAVRYRMRRLIGSMADSIERYGRAVNWRRRNIKQRFVFARGFSMHTTAIRTRASCPDIWLRHRPFFRLTSLFQPAANEYARDGSPYIRYYVNHSSSDCPNPEKNAKIRLNHP